MNVGPLMQEVDDIEQRGLDRHAIRLHRFSRDRANGGRELVFYSVVQLAKKQRSVGIWRLCDVLCHFVLQGSFSHVENDTKLPLQFPFG
jgi:hypothetical protein